MIGAREPTERAMLRQFLVNHFDLTEQKNLAFDLDVNYQLFCHETVQDFARELIAYFERRDQLKCLVTAVLKQRYDDDLAQLLVKLPTCPPQKKIIVFVTNDLVEDVSLIVKYLAAKLGVSKDEIKIIALTGGSMRILVSVPEKAADAQILSDIRSLGDGKYQVISIDLFDSLDPASQKAWRFAACKKPPIRHDNVLFPAVSWKEALEATKEAPSSVHSTPSERLPTELLQQMLENRLDTEKQLREAYLMGIEQVYGVMNVVRQTLEIRLKTEEQAREMVAGAREQLDEQLGPLQQFYQHFQVTIKRSRQAIEERASQLAQVSRHDFRRKTSELNSFAQQFDTFSAEFEVLEEERRTFGARVPYIRGIAAHCANQPENAVKYLNDVVSSHQPEPGEDAIAYKRRVANAYYYLGLTESNFGNNEKAIELFEKANELDLQARDFLTRVVTAEAYVMMKDFDKAQGYIDYVERRLNEIESEEGHLRNFHLRLRSRAALIRANIAILRREANWHQEVQRLLNETVYVTDPQYYYATATLAQIHYDQGATGKAQELFHKAYQSIERSGHLLTVTESRSRILLLMVAGMCCKHGLMDEKRAEQHLDEADHLRDSLPRMGSQVCTVFSTLSKRNESSDTIRRHIELIRRGEVLL
jgi:tetratricopeptide (TPR) repeat protein